MNEKTAVVVYHANCTDGFGAAWAWNFHCAHLYCAKKFIPMSYGERLEEKGDDLYILDFSFPSDYLIELCEKFEKVVLLDHHKTAIENLTGTFPDNLTLVLDSSRSGAGIAWDYFSNGIPRPPLINYIEDRDLWKFSLPHSREITTYIQSLPLNFLQFSIVHRDLKFIPDEIVKLGAAQIILLDQICTDIIKTCTRPILIGGQRGAVCNCNAKFASDVGNRLAMDNLFGATYYHASNDDVVFSLRSIGDFDVSAIAKQFGGGGHKNAAGFVLKNPAAFNPDDPLGITLWST